MYKFEKLVNGIYHLKIPFENIYTSVFAIVSDGKTVLFDSGSNEHDAKNIIVPSLKERGFSPDYIILSHFHGDHSGGVETLVKEYPDAIVGAFGNLLGKEYKNLQYRRFCDGETVYGDVEFLNLKGHTDDCGALFDKKTKTLLSVDCLQLCGIGKYGCAISDASEYLKSIDRVLKKDVENVVASHEYVPLGLGVYGRQNVEKYVNECKSYIKTLYAFVLDHKDKKPEEIALIYNKKSGLPPVPQGTFESLKKI